MGIAERANRNSLINMPINIERDVLDRFGRPVKVNDIVSIPEAPGTYWRIVEIKGGVDPRMPKNVRQLLLVASTGMVAEVNTPQTNLVLVVPAQAAVNSETGEPKPADPAADIPKEKGIILP